MSDCSCRPEGICKDVLTKDGKGTEVSQEVQDLGQEEGQQILVLQHQWVEIHWFQRGSCGRWLLHCWGLCRKNQWMIFDESQSIKW